MTFEIDSENAILDCTLPGIRDWNFLTQTPTSSIVLNVPSHPNSATKQSMAMPTHKGAAPPLLRGKGLVYHTIRLSKGDDRALLGLWGGEAEETGHSEVSGVKGMKCWQITRKA